MPKNTEENSQKSIKRTNESSIDLESKEAKLAKKLKSLESRSLASVTIPYTNVPGNNKINSKQPLPSPTTTVDTEKVSVCQDQETSIETNNITTEKTTLMDTEAVMDHDTTTFISSTSTTKTKTIDNQQSIRTMVSQDQETSKETTDTVPTIDDKKPVSAMAARRAKKLELEARSTAATLDTTSTTASPPSPTPATTTTSTTDPSQPERPLSALAARRAKKVATDETSIPSSPVDDLPKSTITPDRVMNSLFRETETEAESDLEYLSAEADFDMDDDDDDDQKLEIMSTPPTISDSEYKDTNDKEDMTKIKEAKRLAKLEEKLANMLVDPYSVSTFDSENVVAFEHNGETCFCIGFKKNQVIIYYYNNNNKIIKKRRTE
ncbi:uncharacterized protein BX664DRAFT_199221 [Halteromyces radiatus]|uniref:uncharacterized protein n=1 Tax=Halteromyces radiatus TaxID=101107 RepID=UPI00221FD296|nr:uncharacterized protein BX664DRAFT_199221 [Halteromyces radiatus]KAI8081712.1 hypothetical protein BX664DRAFT_199221 [Halteromyces radiatus]